MTDWGDEVLRHKYDPLPEEAPRHRKKSKKRHVRSDHKHEYEKVCIDAHERFFTSKDGWQDIYTIGKRCKICGRLHNYTTRTSQTERPDGMRLFEVSDWYTLFKMRELPEQLEVIE